MRKVMVFVMIAMVITALVIATGCGVDEEETRGICVDPQTEVRVDDDMCESDEFEYDSAMVIWWMRSGQSYPRVGQRVNKSHVTTKAPSGSNTKLGLPSKGGTIKKPSTGDGGNGGGGSKPKAPAPKPAPKPR